MPIVPGIPVPVPLPPAMLIFAPAMFEPLPPVPLIAYAVGVALVTPLPKKTSVIGEVPFPATN